MLSVKKGFIILVCVITAMVISSAVAQQLFEETSFEKIGKIKRIKHFYPIAGDCCSCPLTHIEFEDGDVLQLWDIWKNIEEGKTYRIVYQKKDRMCINDDPTYKAIKTTTANVVEEIEEIFP